MRRWRLLIAVVGAAACQDAAPTAVRLTVTGGEALGADSLAVHANGAVHEAPLAPHLRLLIPDE
jgi:hypothetical protein